MNIVGNGLLLLAADSPKDPVLVWPRSIRTGNFPPHPGANRSEMGDVFSEVIFFKKIQQHRLFWEVFPWISRYVRIFTRI